MGWDAEARAERDESDIAAVAKLAAGDRTALGELYARYASTALGIAVRIVSNRDEAEDVVHDAFVTVCERVDQFRPERGTVAAWLLTTVRNLAVDRARRSSRRAQIVQNDLAHELREEFMQPDTQLTLERERHAVREALTLLPEAQRATLIVAFFEGLSYPEIAQREGVALGTVKSRAARAVHFLRDTLTAPTLPPSQNASDPNDS